MAWDHELYIDGNCAWPSSVCVVRGRTGERKYYIPERLCYPRLEYLDDHSELGVTVCSCCHVACIDLEDCYYCPNCGARVVD